MIVLYIGIGMVVFGALAAAGGVLVRRSARRILAAPLRRTGELAAGTAAGGVVGCEGAVRTHQPLVAPCSGTPCVYYHLRVERQVKEQRGGQTTTSWKLVADQHRGSAFWLDDGTGPVAVDAHEPADADLAQVYRGAPPGGPGLGALATVIAPPPPGGREEVLGYRVTEKVVRTDGRLFVLGQLQGGQLTRPPSGKLLLSTRGRDALVGAKRRAGAILLAAGAVIAAAGVPVAVLQPGVTRPCGAMKDEVGACAVTSWKEIDTEHTGVDGAVTRGKVMRAELTWEVTRPTVFELSAREAKGKGKSFPRVQVEDAIGFPVNVGINWGIGSDSGSSTSTKTTTLAPGKHRVYVFVEKTGERRLILSIKDVGAGVVGHAAP